MGETLSSDLRARVIKAVEGGMSRRGAAARFGVGMSTAVAWVRAWRDEGRVAAKPKGGDTRSRRIEAHHGAIMAAVEAQPDATLAELAALLEREHGASFATSTVHRFLARHRITFKKSRRTLRSRTVRTCAGAGRPGSRRSPTSTPSA